MPKPKDPTPRRTARQVFGSEMRRCREEAGMTLEDLAGIVNYGKSSLARFETAESMIPSDLPGPLDAHFKTGGIFDKLFEVARYELHPDQFRRRMELESQARLIEEYSGQLMIGLVQTEDYARALFIASNPRATPEEIEDLVSARLSRQEALSRDSPPDQHIILDEAVFHRAVGGPSVMRAQLAHLLEVMLTPTITLQILPFSDGEHALMGGSLALLSMADGTQVAWEESIVSGTLIEDRASVTHYQRAYNLLKACALSPKNSAAFIRSAMEDLHT